MRTKLWSLIPDPKVLSALDSDQLAHAVMTCLRSSSEDSFNLYNLGREGAFTSGYPPEFRDTIDRVVSGAWSYLQGRGYLGQKPGAHDSSFLVITPQGERWHSNINYGNYGSASAPTSPALPPRPWGSSELAQFTDDDLHRAMVDSQPGSNDWELMKAELEHRDRKRQSEGDTDQTVQIPEDALDLLRAISRHSENSSTPVFVMDLGLDLDERMAKSAWEYLRDRNLIRTYSLPFTARINANGTDLLEQMLNAPRSSRPLSRDAERSTPASGGERTSKTVQIGDENMFEKLDQSARNVLGRATGISQASRSDGLVHMEHLVKGLLDEPASGARDFFERAGLTIERVVEIISTAIGRSLPGTYTNTEPVAMPKVSKHVGAAVKSAAQHAFEEGADLVGGTHLLRGALSVGGCSVIKALTPLLMQNGNSRPTGEEPVPAIPEPERKTDPRRPSPRSRTTPDEATPDLPSRTQSETEENVGPSTHVARDKWTIDDALGYYPYAYAIYRFLTDKDTAPPLAISIQAPWGGGKTSLMRMIQAQLDPDNPVFRRVKTAGAPDKQTSATIKQIEDVIQTGGQDPKPDQIDVGSVKNRVTVWFNAWKYESTDQIWAGLADSIVKQVTERLSPVKREVFFFRLHLKRLDIAKIRKKITDGVLSKLYELFVHWWWLYLVIPVATYYVQHWKVAANYLPSISAASPLGGVFDLGLLVFQAILARKRNLSTPAKIELGDLVKAPDYDANLGFIHLVSEDLKITLELVAPSSRPLVIFIDDLDRCSPGKVCAVVEAVNLFLAGEFEHCMFVLGIDDEVVAAALNKAHADVFALMPAYARATSIGWRFMDKFVQLPFIMPPPTPSEMANYAESLLVTKEMKGKLTLQARQKVATSVEEDQTGKSIEAIVEEVNQALQLDPAQKSELTNDAATIAKMNKDIKEFTDNDNGIGQIIKNGIKNFSRNPREAKRFVNSFRFYYFLRSALLARRAQAPSVEQLSRWIVLSLRWPTIVRWLRTTEPNPERSKTNGLAELSKLVEKSKDGATWAEGAANLIGLDKKDRAWVSDEQLFDFFKNEHELPETEQLSSSIGRGLW